MFSAAQPVSPGSIPIVRPANFSASAHLIYALSQQFLATPDGVTDLWRNEEGNDRDVTSLVPCKSTSCSSRYGTVPNCLSRIKQVGFVSATTSSREHARGHAQIITRKMLDFTSIFGSEATTAYPNGPSQMTLRHMRPIHRVYGGYRSTKYATR